MQQQNYAKAFRVIRAAFGLSQAELAARMPITASQLSLIESGKRQPSIRAVEALAKALRIPAPLVTLLASTSDDVDSRSSDDIADLARALLRLLISAKEEPQRSLDFSE